MKRFKEIILSTVEPTDTNVLWLNPDLDELLYYSNNGWSPIYLDSSIIEPKSVRIERVETHIGKGAEYGDRPYLLYKANINPSSTNVPYLISWSVDIFDNVGYNLIAIDLLDNHYCKLFFDDANSYLLIPLSVTITYGNKVIKNSLTIEPGSDLIINILSNLKDIDGFLFERFGAECLFLGDVEGNKLTPLTSGLSIKVSPNTLYKIIIKDELAVHYDWIGAIKENLYLYSYNIESPSFGESLTKTIKCKARAVKVTCKYKDEIVPCLGVCPFINNIYNADELIIDGGSDGNRPDGTYISIIPYRFKDATLTTIPSEWDSNGTSDIVHLFYDDIITNDFKDDYTEVTLEGYTIEDREDIILSYNPLKPSNSKNLKVWDILSYNLVPRSNYLYFTKEDVAKITDIGTWFEGSDIETFDEFLYFTGITELSRNAFYSCKSLTSIIIPKNITEIPDDCFNYCIELLNISIPSSVNKIGQAAFKSCSELSSIDLSNVESIGGWAFSSSGLTSLILPNSISTVPDYLCYNCSKLTSVLLPTHITSIGEYSFASCGLLNINIPDSIVTIGDFAFMKNLLLTSLNIGKDCNLLSIGKQAFKETKISELLIPKNVNLIESYAFYNIETLLSITFYGTQTESKVTIKPCAFAIDTNRTSVLDTIEFMSTYIRLPNIISINSTIFDNVASNGTIYVRSYSNGWESDLGIKYLLEDKGWTISYTISATGVIIDNPTSDDNKYEVDLGDSI